MLSHRGCWLLILAILTSSCSVRPNYQDLSATVRYETLSFPEAVYESLVWFKDGELVAFVGLTMDPTSVITRLDYDIKHNPYASEGDLEIHDLRFGDDKDCTLYTTYSPGLLLPDGRLGMIEMCERKGQESTVSEASRYLVAYDWKTGILEKILDYPLPNPMRSGCFSWNPQMTRAIQSTNDGITGSLYWLTSQGPEPLQLVLKDGEKQWDISKSYAGNGDSSEGVAGCPQWSRDGDQIYFFASLDAIGKSGFSRLDTYYDLYSYSVNSSRAEIILPNVFSPSNLRLSPDGRLIAFVATNRNEENSSLWIFRVEDKKVFQIIKSGNLQAIEWSPNSMALAVIWCDDIGCSRTEIRKYDLNLH